ncbi:Alpha/Beta hydrolase protein [Crassisporium funariophilum]|nr:Alpha/Beta hydrolase protein [Crassisporium funariophilum]
MSTPPASCTTLSYKCLTNDKEVLLDFYPPETSGNAPPIIKVPAVVFFHAGGLILGNRRFLFPTWLQKRANSLGYAFISADYQLLLPGTGHDILNDVRDVFKYIEENYFTYRKTTFEIDPEKIVVAGGSSGGGLAQLAAAHVTSPKPKGVLALYAMGGDFFTSHWLDPKTKPFFMGRPLLDPSHSKALLPPFPEGLPAPTSDVLPAFNPTTRLPAEPRMALTSLSLQLGNWLDYYTGEFEPSLSKTLRDALDAGVPRLTVRDLVPERHRSLFPTFLVNASWPPTLLVHGTADTAVPILSSRRMNILLKNAGVDVQLIEVEGKEHLFDIEQNADVEFAGVFDKVEEFLKTCMQK